MAYSICFEKAAQRHFDAGEYLYSNTHRIDVAGYLYGISAECAIKKIMSLSGIRPHQQQDRRNDPLYAHFPELKTLLRSHIRGRHAQTLLKFIENRYMQEWDVKMRYSPPVDIDKNLVRLWREQAILAIRAMNGS